jgi:hypothetical protein
LKMAKGKVKNHGTRKLERTKWRSIMGGAVVSSCILSPLAALLTNNVLFPSDCQRSFPRGHQ